MLIWTKRNSAAWHYSEGTNPVLVLCLSREMQCSPLVSPSRGDWPIAFEGSVPSHEWLREWGVTGSASCVRMITYPPDFCPKSACRLCYWPDSRFTKPAWIIPYAQVLSYLLIGKCKRQMCGTGFNTVWSDGIEDNFHVRVCSVHSQSFTTLTWVPKYISVNIMLKYAWIVINYTSISDSDFVKEHNIISR